MAKKIKQVKEVNSEEKLSLENINVGDIILDLHDEEIEITDDLIEQMRKYEQETKKSAIWKNKITGVFLFFKWYEDNPEEKLKTKKKPGRKPKKVEEDVDIDEVIEENIIDKENELLDCIADYKVEFGVNKVNTNTKKFKAFFEEWKNSE